MSLLLLIALPQGPSTVDAVKGARVITLSGEEIPKGTIVIKDGRIEAVGADVEIPWDARVLDAAGKVVLPGWVEAHSSAGLDRPNEGPASVPFVSVPDAINPVHPAFEEALRNGVTSILVMPGNGGMIGGRGAVVRPAGVTVEEMLVRRDAAMKISLAPPSDRSKMAHLAALRKEFDDVRDYLAALKEKTELPAAVTPRAKQELDVKKKPMTDLVQGKLPVFIYAPTAGDLVRAHELAAAYGLKATYVLGAGAWPAAAYVREHKLDVVLDPALSYWEIDEATRREVRRVPPKIFHDAGAAFSLQSGPGLAEMWNQVAVCVKYGVPREAALKAATVNPARMIGMADRIGTIEKGRDANLQILSGDPLDVATWVEKVVIEGRLVYDRDKDAKLRRLLGKEE